MYGCLILPSFALWRTWKLLSNGNVKSHDQFGSVGYLHSPSNSNQAPVFDLYINLIHMKIHVAQNKLDKDNFWIHKKKKRRTAGIDNGDHSGFKREHRSTLFKKSAARK